MKSYLAKMDQFPPYRCLLLARDKHRNPITVAQIAIATGFSEAKVRRIGKRRSWANVTVKDADNFRIACGITPENEKRHRAYLKRTTRLLQYGSGLIHLRRKPRAMKLVRALVLKTIPVASSTPENAVQSD